MRYNKCCSKRERDATGKRCKHCSRAMIFLPGEKPKTPAELLSQLEKEVWALLAKAAEKGVTL